MSDPYSLKKNIVAEKEIRSILGNFISSDAVHGFEDAYFDYNLAFSSLPDSNDNNHNKFLYKNNPTIVQAIQDQYHARLTNYINNLLSVILEAKTAIDKFLDCQIKMTINLELDIKTKRIGFLNESSFDQLTLTNVAPAIYVNDILSRIDFAISDMKDIGALIAEPINDNLESPILKKIKNFIPVGGIKRKHFNFIPTTGFAYYDPVVRFESIRPVRESDTILNLGYNRMVFNEIYLKLCKIQRNLSDLINHWFVDSVTGVTSRNSRIEKLTRQLCTNSYTNDTVDHKTAVKVRAERITTALSILLNAIIPTLLTETAEFAKVVNKVSQAVKSSTGVETLNKKSRYMTASYLPQKDKLTQSQEYMVFEQKGKHQEHHDYLTGMFKYLCENYQDISNLLTNQLEKVKTGNQRTSSLLNDYLNAWYVYCCALDGILSGILSKIKPTNNWRTFSIDNELIANWRINSLPSILEALDIEAIKTISNVAIPVKYKSDIRTILHDEEKRTYLNDQHLCNYIERLEQFNDVLPSIYRNLVMFKDICTKLPVSDYADDNIVTMKSLYGLICDMTQLGDIFKSDLQLLCK